MQQFSQIGYPNATELNNNFKLLYRSTLVHLENETLGIVCLVNRKIVTQDTIFDQAAMVTVCQPVKIDFLASCSYAI